MEAFVVSVFFISVTNCFVLASSRVSEDSRNVALPKNNPSDLQILKEFDLALEFGPCAGKR